MGLLTGKYSADSQLPADDVRAAQPWWGYFTGGCAAPAWLARLHAVRVGSWTHTSRPCSRMVK
jgi:hypothetical protein